MTTSRKSDALPGSTTGIAVLCDVRQSRMLPERVQFARRLESALERANQNSDAIIGRFERQAGVDEFAGILRPGQVGKVLVGLWQDLHPVAVRYAITKGQLDVVPPPADRRRGAGASKFDGPALHAAARQLDELRTGAALVSIRCTDAWGDKALTALADLLYGEILGWTERQLEVVRAYRRLGSQQSAAAALGIDQPGVSRALSAARYDRVEAASDAFVETIDHLSRSTTR